MRRFTILLFCLLTYSVVQAQYYSEDFSNGFNGWTVRTTMCGILPGEYTGTWSLVEATYSGVEIPGLDARFIITSTLEYAASVSTPLGDGYIQGKYELLTDTFSSNLNGELLPLDEPAYGVDTGGLYTEWYSNLNVPQTLLDQGGNTAFGIGNPSITVDNDTLILNSQDGLTSLTYLRINDCGQVWEWNHNGNVGKGALAGDGTQITSPTAANGSISLNADFLSTRGDIANLPPGGPPYPQYVSELISPVMDLSAVTGAVSLRFSQMIRFLNPASSAPCSGCRTSYAISTDGGVTWGEPIQLNASLAVNAAPLNSTEEVGLVGVQGSSQVRVKFTFAADFYYWVIDDVAVVDRIAYDMQINTNFYAIYPNAVTPISQVESTGFIADIQNNGGFDATNTVLNLTIVNDATGAEIYNVDKFYGTIIPDSLAENDFFDELLDPSLLEVGSFTGTYSISQDSTDLNPANDTIRWQMFVTDTLFAKETGRTRSIAPAADDSYYYGNCFYTPNGDGWFARYITFAANNTSQLTDRTITTFLYQWEGDTNDDGLANPEEYGNAPIAFNSYTFTGMEAGGELITLPFDLDGNAIPLQDETFYMAIIQYATDDEQAFFLEASAAHDYSAMHFLTDSLGFERHAAMLVVGNDPNPAFSSIGFGRNFVPVVRMSIGTNPDLNGPAIVGTREVLSDANTFKVYPNPANNEVFVEVELEEMSKKVEIQVFDVTGKMLHYQKHSNMHTGKFNYDVSSLAGGTYFIRIVTDQGIKTQKLVVKR